MREQLNCPNCGAPITSGECEYCGTLFYDFAMIQNDRPTFVKIKVDKTLITAKCLLTDVTMNISYGEATANLKLLLIPDQDVWITEKIPD